MDFSGLFGKYRLREPQLPEAKELARQCHTTTTMALLLLQRGLADAGSVSRFLEASLNEMSDPTTIADSDLAAQRLARAIRAHERIVVFGDYDVDGTTAAAILSEVLETLGADVQTLAADRFAGGYGLSAAALQLCLACKPSVLVTCDCGSSDHERIAEAKSCGVDVIVIDHHLVPEEALPAFAFINPRRPDCPSTYKDFVSAGLAFVMGAAIRRALNRELDMRSWLDLVALGTIADVAPLQSDNRRFVRAGLQRLASANARPGVVALRECANLPTGSMISASDVGFRLAPRINAAGRLGSANVALQLLKSRSLSEARMLAAQLESLNQQRKQLTESATKEAIDQVTQHYGNEPQGGVVAASNHWHPGVLGIVAARLVEHFSVSASACSMFEGSYRGSARAADGSDVHAALHAMRDLLIKWGGHKAAAGLEFAESSLSQVREAFATYAPRIDKKGSESEIAAHVETMEDVPTFAELHQLEPLGQGNPCPIFAISSKVESLKSVGKGSHLSLQIRLGTGSIRVFAPNFAPHTDRIRAAQGCIGELRPNEWQGRRQVELLLRDVF